MANLNTGLTSEQVLQAFYRALNDMTDEQIQALVATKADTSDVTSAISTAIEGLDVSSVGGTGKYISAISETDGKISATAKNLATAVESDGANAVTSGAVYNSIFPTQDSLAYIIDTYYKQNVLQNNAESTTVGSEVTFTVNADGSITAEVIATKTTSNRQLSWYATVPAGTWYFSTGQSHSGGSGYPCQAYLYTSETIARDYTDQEFTLAEAASLRCYIQIKKDVVQGTTFNFYPMICIKELYEGSNKYLPFSGS